MKNARFVFTLLFCGVLFTSITGAKASLSVSDKASLQAAMQRYISRSLVNGTYLSMNRKTGDIRALHPVTAHPAILQLGKYFVLCFDFRDDRGKSVNIDFYIARREQSYVVFHSEVDNRVLLQRLMKAGKAKRAD